MPILRTPLLFVGHGNPINAIEDNAFSREWIRLGKKLTKPKAIVCMSAHWLTKGSYVTSTLSPEIIYDFYGFPDKLYHVAYPAKGDPQTAADIQKNAPQIHTSADWGLDHGAWSVLKRMFPDAGVPVLQISIDYGTPPHVQYHLMAKLRVLREKGILFIGSGNIVHNLGMVKQDSKPYGWALEFEDQSKKLIEKGDSKALLDYPRLGKAAAMSIPTDDHYRPMLNTLGLRYDDEIPFFFNRGIDLASVSMMSFAYGL